MKQERYTRSREKSQFANKKRAHHIVYHPNSSWFDPPLNAWIPNTNRVQFLVYITFVTVLVLLARFTPFCGSPVDGANADEFCSKNWLFENDHILKFISAGMFILVAFRGSNSYQKYWEGRVAWGRIQTVSKDLAHMMCCHITVETAIDEIELKRMMTYIGAVSISAKALLRRETSIREDLKGLLSENEIKDIDNALHSPNYCLDVLGHYLAKQVRTKKLELPTNALIYSTGVLQISKAVGDMERLRNSFIPVIYTLHQRLIMVIWLVLVSMYFLNKYRWYTIPLGSVVAYILLGIDSMSCEIEEPFGYDKNDLNLTMFCQSILQETQDIYHRRSKFGNSPVLQRLQSRHGSRRERNIEAINEADRQISFSKIVSTIANDNQYVLTRGSSKTSSSSPSDHDIEMGEEI